MTTSLLNQPRTIFRAECPSCGNILGDKETSYRNLLSRGYTPEEAMNELGIKNFCCRSRVMCPVVIPRGVNIITDQFAKNIYYHVNTKPRIVAQRVPVLLFLQRRNGKEYITTFKPRPRLCNAEEFIKRDVSLTITSPTEDRNIVKGTKLTNLSAIDTNYTTETFVEPRRREYFKLK